MLRRAKINKDYREIIELEEFLNVKGNTSRICEPAIEDYNNRIDPSLSQLEGYFEAEFDYYVDGVFENSLTPPPSPNFRNYSDLRLGDVRVTTRIEFLSSYSSV